jgi:hypothetical protein
MVVIDLGVLLAVEPVRASQTPDWLIMNNIVGGLRVPEYLHNSAIRC